MTLREQNLRAEIEAVFLEFARERHIRIGAHLGDYGPVAYSNVIDFALSQRLEERNAQIDRDAEISKKAHYEYCGKANRFPCEELAEYQTAEIRSQKE